MASEHKHYKILKEEDIKQLVNNDISSVSIALSISRGLACSLLCQNGWSLTSVYNQQLPDYDRSDELPIGEEDLCKICLEKTRPEDMVFAACGHPFCSCCWTTYIATSINNGPGCLTLLCPEPDCKSFVGLELVDLLVLSDDRDRYYRYLCRSYVEGCTSRKWCPAPGCDLAIEFDGDWVKSYDVTCACFYNFCWNCTEENHRPVDCKTAARWIEKNSSEDENVTWLQAYTKQCPKCKRLIERKYGCNQVTCHCNFRFCWVCLRSCKSHKGSHFSCYKYESEKSRINAQETSRTNAKKDLKLYKHYYERWDYNDKAAKRASVDLNHARNECVNTLRKLHGDEPFQFVIEAWEEIVKCRRVLKWSYAYVYYLSLEKIYRDKVKFFECMQGEAEVVVKRLHYCAEKEMEKYLHFCCEGFKDFRSKLVDLNAVTRNYLENFVRVFENSFCEVECSGTKSIERSKNEKPRKSSDSQKPRKRLTYAAMYA